MPRWRDIKQGKITEESSKKIQKKAKNTPKNSLPFASNLDKAKAFLTDTFMIVMPIMYIVIYIGYNNLQNVAKHRLEVWGFILGITAIVITLFYVLKGQTPGLKAYNLKVIDIKTKKKPSLILAFLRYIFFTLNLFTIVGPFYSLFRKDKRGLHDLLSGTAVVYDKPTK